jgi:outer membrane biosynthesis protein TonB
MEEESGSGIIKFLSDYKIFIIFGISIILCFVFVMLFLYKKQNNDNNLTIIKQYEKQNDELIKENHNLAKQLQLIQENSEPEPEIKVEPEPETKVKPEPEIKVKPEPEIKVEPEPDFPTDTQIHEHAQKIKEDFTQEEEDEKEVNIDVDDILNSVL